MTLLRINPADSNNKTMAIHSLYRAGRITRETALHYADHPEQLQRNLG